MTTEKAANIYEELKNYFENTPQDQILKDWKETEDWDKVGPTVEEFFYFTQQCDNLKLGIPLINGNVIKKSNISPEFTSGFFLN